MGILPPGFRFHPTDVELIMYYLKKKVMAKKFQFEAMAELNVYKYEPWDLADKSLLKRDLQWYFFSPRERKYGSGARKNRATETGYWKATGKDRSVIYSNRTVGMIKTLIFYKGHAPKGERTDWVMHEYRIEDKNLSDIGIIQDSNVICKIFQKSGLGPKNGAQYGAPFSEEEWNEVESAEEECPFPTEHLQPSNHNTSAAVSFAGTTTSCSITMSKVVQCPTQPLAINQPCSTADTSESVVSWLPICDVAMHPIENYTTENTNVLFGSPQGAQGPIASVAFREEVNNAREICAIPSPVNVQVPSVHSPYRDLDNLAALNSIVPGTTSSWPLSEPGPPRPSATSTLVTNMPYDLPEDDITALLSLFSEDRSMIPIEDNEHVNTDHIDQPLSAQTCVDEISIYNGLGDLNNLGERRNSGFQFSNTCDANCTPNTMLLDGDMVFLELKDLDSPLKHPAEARESVWGPSDRSYSPYTCYRNFDGSFCGSNLPKSVQNVSRLNSTSFTPEGPRMEDIAEVSWKGPDTQNLNFFGSETIMGNNIPFQVSRRQAEGSSIASQIQRRGKRHRKFRLQFSLESKYAQLSVAELFAHIITVEKLNDSWSHCGGSTIYFKAEVALKVGECTEDALSHDMGESNCMCFYWVNPPENNLGENNCGLAYEIISYEWIILSLLGKIIVKRAKYLIDIIMASFFFPNCCVVLFIHGSKGVYINARVAKTLNKT